MIPCSRLQEWFIPHREQAGAQPKRGCLEHIVTLRMLVDTAKRKKKKLFIMFVDFSQAYDRVSRKKLFSLMKNMGCGMVMLGALVAMYKSTQSIIGTVIITPLYSGPLFLGIFSLNFFFPNIYSFLSSSFHHGSVVSHFLMLFFL